MRRILRFSALLLTLTLALGAVTAQTPSDKEVAALEKSLQLTPSQLAKRKAIENKYRVKLTAAIKQYQTETNRLLEGKQNKALYEKLKKAKERSTTEVMRLTRALSKERDALYTPEQRARVAAFAKKQQAALGQAPR